MPLPRLRTTLQLLALTGGSIVLTFLAVEVAFRLLHVSVGTVQINRETVRQVDNPRLRFDLRPGSLARAEVEYRINAHGLRGPETSVEKPSGVRRIAVLGDSIAFGYWVAEEEAFPHQLQEMLNQDSSGAKVEVLNFAVPGYNLDQSIETLQVKALGFDPDVVVLGFCLNDLETIFSHELGLVQDRAERSRSFLGSLREVLLHRSLLFSWIEYRSSELKARRRFVNAKSILGSSLYGMAVQEQRRVVETKFAALRALLAPRGIAGLVAIFPVLNKPFERYPHRELHRLVAEAAAANGLSTRDLLSCYSAYHFNDVRIDPIHPSPLGHRIAAHALRDALCNPGGAVCGGAGSPGPSCTGYRPENFPKRRGY
jgi:lysophospholipase L1-like esterase